MTRAKNAGYSGRFSAAALVLACAAALLAGTGNSRAGEASQAAEVGTHYSVSVSGLELLDQETGEIELAWSVTPRARDHEIPQNIGSSTSLTGRGSFAAAFRGFGTWRGSPILGNFFVSLQTGTFNFKGVSPAPVPDRLFAAFPGP